MWTTGACVTSFAVTRNGIFCALFPEHSWRMDQPRLTMVSVKDENRREYGQKETVTLGYVGTDQHLEMLVNLYNRQSKRYRIEPCSLRK